MKPKEKGTEIREPSRDQKSYRIGLQGGDVCHPYPLRTSLPNPTRCPECGAIFRRGRWTWGTAPPDAHMEICPACRRIQDHSPAGIVHLSGSFFRKHKEEILYWVRHQEDKIKRNHPLSRIISMGEDEYGTVITTTDPYLPRRIGEALWESYQGELTVHYGQDPRLVQMTWKV